MQKEKSDELSKMFSYAGNYHKLTILGCILAGISTIFSMLPFVCIWFVIRDLIHGLSQGDVTLAAGSSHYAWMALLFSVLSIFLYFLALIFSHLAAFRTATNMRKKAVHHIVELPLGYFSQNASGRLRKVIDDNAGLTEGFLAHQLPDLTGAVVMPVAVIILIFVFDWRMGICCLIPMTGFTVALNSTFVLLIPAAMIILSGLSGQISYEETVLDFLFYALFTPVCTTMMNRIMFASEQLMAAKSAVSRVEAVIQEKTLPESVQKQKPADTGIVFKNISFSYPGASEKALDNVSFEVPAGKTVALVGASGSGKSTAASLIPRFYDVQEGSVLIGGADVRNIDKRDLMEHVAFVFQNTRLFKDTLLENIRAARPSATCEEVLKAAETAKCTEIIDRLPNGLDTVVGSGGTYLSGGENQRIALARAILKDAPIVVLDEATAFADAENEHQIQLAFEELTKGKSVLMIAHRLSTIQDADQILVFKDGKIIERGTHNELLEKKGTYASMWKDYQTSVSWKVGEGDEKHD